MPDSTSTKAATPLWVISLFISLTEVVTGIAATQTTGGVQVALTAFVIVFPLIIATMFFLFLWFKPQNFYPPFQYEGVDITTYVAGLRGEVHEARGEIDQLYALSMSTDAFENLKKLATDHFGPFWLHWDLQFGLAAELNYFKMLGYIEFDKIEEVPDVEQLPKGQHDDDDLSRYIRVTPLGHEFIAVRTKAEERLTNR